MNWTLLKTLCETPAVPGREEKMRAVVKTEMEPLVDSLDVDVMGNVIGRKKRDAGRKVMVAAHMDEIGFYVKFIEDKGFLRLQAVGGFDPRQLFAQRVLVHVQGGDALPGVLTYTTKPTHLLTAEEAGKAPKIENFFVDLGLPSEAVRENVRVGDFVTMDRGLMECGDVVVSKAIDNRVGVFVLLETLKRLKQIEVDLYAVATVQEEVGLRGAGTSAFSITPDVSIALDTTLACDYPGNADADAVTRLGEGVAIKIMDSSLICHPRLVDHFRTLAEDRKISHQMEILPRGGTDAGAMQRSAGGNVSMTLSIPTRYIHTVNEMAHKQDIEAAIDLLVAYIEASHTGDYRW